MTLNNFYRQVALFILGLKILVKITLETNKISINIFNFISIVKRIILNLKIDNVPVRKFRSNPGDHFPRGLH